MHCAGDEWETTGVAMPASGDAVEGHALTRRGIDLKTHRIFLPPAQIQKRARCYPRHVVSPFQEPFFGGVWPKHGNFLVIDRETQGIVLPPFQNQSKRHVNHTQMNDVVMLSVTNQ